MDIISESVTIGERKLSLEVGRFAEQATSAVLARYGDTMVFSTVVYSEKETQLNYFPLKIDYVERLYAGGRIKGSRWVKREGRPSDDAILSGRLIDRSIRPLFDQRFKHDIQIIVTVLSVDGNNSPDILGLVATSAALAISPIPWKGPIGCVRTGYISPKNGNSGTFVNPTEKDMDFSDLDLIVSSTEKKVVMIESAANELSEDNMLSSITFAHKENQKIIKCINKLVKKIGQKKIIIDDDEKNKKIQKVLKDQFKKEIDKYIKSKIDKKKTYNLESLIEKVSEKLEDKYKQKEIEKEINNIFKQKVREDILLKGKRIDGRDSDTIRPIEIDVGILPRTHGSAMFKRGQTQVLTVATLGSPSLEQLIEGPEGETAKRYIHHYSMPPYSVGETGRYGYPSRREIGHGALAEKAMLPVIPKQNNFPYTIRLVSEVLSSNGSTSMASTCGSTLALMDAGVPIKSPVVGISTGLVTKANKHVLLSDISGTEDFFGDMDFKIAGTKKGITAIQLDVKIEGLSKEIIKETLIKSKKDRNHIMKKLLEVIPKPRKSLSQYAPRVMMIQIPEDKIGEVIGPGGKMIRQIISETGADINIDDDGKVTISGTEPEGVDKANKWISGIIKEIKPEEVYRGIVRRILPFGAMVEILPGREGMVHISQMSTEYVSNPADVLNVDDQITVRVTEIDEHGRVNLSMLFGEDAKKVQSRKRGKDKKFQRKRSKRRY